MTDLKPKKIGENEYQIDADSSLGMKVPVTIYADETLLQKMMTDRTLKQAINVSTLPGIQKHAVVLPDGTLFGEGVKTRIKEDLMEKCSQ